jgi:hypothetical protein
MTKSTYSALNSNRCSSRKEENDADMHLHMKYNHHPETAHRQPVDNGKHGHEMCPVHTAQNK